MYTVLIGSYARGTSRDKSDLDIVRINHLDGLDRNFIPSESTVLSYIDYTYSAFLDLYDSGSLFLYHIFNEGKLLAGDDDSWAVLKSQFKVKSSFEKEIDEYIAILHFLNSDTLFCKLIFPYLSNMFKVIKNISIFSLAGKGLYVFEKRESISMAFPFILNEQVDALILAHDIFDRGLELHEAFSNRFHELAEYFGDSWNKFTALP